jgi:type IV pilus assembly protein PilE
VLTETLQMLETDNMPTKSHHGFTLIELAVTVLIAAMLTAIAIPSYLSSVQKGRRSDAYDAVARVQQEQERYRSNNASYADTFTKLGMSGTSEAGYYTLEIADVTARGYSLTATTTGKQSDDKTCKVFQLVMLRGGISKKAVGSDGTDRSTQCWAQ